jgi:hypothetical protein
MSRKEKEILLTDNLDITLPRAEISGKMINPNSLNDDKRYRFYCINDTTLAYYWGITKADVLSNLGALEDCAVFVQELVS